MKTRIRTAVRKLRFLLAPLGAAAIAIAVLVGAGVRIAHQRQQALRMDRVLAMVTASDITTLHVPPVPGAPAATHGSYRGKPGTPIAVLAAHGFAPAPAGRVYQAWVLHRGTWTSMGTFFPDAGGDAVIDAEGPPFAELPEAVEITIEPRPGSPAPSGPAVILWQGT